MSVVGIQLLLLQLEVPFVTDLIALFLTHNLVKVFLEHGDIVLKVVLLLTHLLLVLFKLVV